MKSLTEFSGLVIRTAAAALVEARRSLPAEEQPKVAAVADASPVTAESPQEPQAGPSAEASAPPAPEVVPGPDANTQNEVVKSALDAAVAKATGLSGDRLAMLRAAVEVAGKRTADVRTIRVFGSEEQVPGAKSLGGHQYVVDYLPQSMKQVTGSKKDERGRGGKGGGAGRGGGRGSGGGRGAGAGATGGFSMDSLRDDRKGERGGGRRPGGAPGGGPKK
jgi:hypothetical protein